jgi:hypothetical protein
LIQRIARISCRAAVSHNSPVAEFIIFITPAVAVIIIDKE